MRDVDNFMRIYELRNELLNRNDQHNPSDSESSGNVETAESESDFEGNSTGGDHSNQEDAGGADFDNIVPNVNADLLNENAQENEVPVAQGGDRGGDSSWLSD